MKRSLRMSDPSSEPPSSKRPPTLRARAAAKLGGAAAAQAAPSKALDALAVLHTLASAPETAANALTLLHELQVHQVELELQTQELLESRGELESALRRHIEIYEGLPVGCLTMDAQFFVLELNQTAAALFGVAREEAYGSPIDAFVCASGAQHLKAAVGELRAGARPASFVVRLARQRAPASPETAQQRGMPALANLAADAVVDQYLLTLTPAEGWPGR